MHYQQSKKTFFDRNGYLIVKDLLNEKEVIECKKEINRLQETAKLLNKSGEIENGDFQIEPFVKESDRESQSPILRKIENTYDHSDLFFQLARHEQIVSIVKEILGPDLMLFRSTLMLKPALHGSEHAFHQDSSYWPIDPPNLVTISIAIDKSTPDNGCIKIIPQSHKSDLKEWGHIAKAPQSKSVTYNITNQTNPLEVPLDPGSALFFHSKLVHGSGPNTSAFSRNTALYAYFNTNVRYVPPSGMPHSRSFPVIAGLEGKKYFEITAD